MKESNWLWVAFSIVALMSATAVAVTDDERRAVFEQYLDFAALVEGGSVQPNWLADGSAFWYAEGGPADWVIWRVDPAAYDFAQPYRLAPQVKGRLMLAGGLADFATFPEFMRMSRALIDAGIDHEQVVLPEEGHGYTGVAEDYFIRKLAAFFARHVMQAER